MLRFCEWEPGEDVHGGKPVLRLAYEVHDDKRIEVVKVATVTGGTYLVYEPDTEMTPIQRIACFRHYRKEFDFNQAFQARCLSACTADYLKKCAASEERFCRN